MTRPGFSLFECLLALALTLFISVAGFEFFGLARKTFFRLKDRGDLTAALTHALADRLESLRSLPFDDASLAPGEHAVTGPVPPGRFALVQEWEVSEEGGGMKLVRLGVRAAGRTGPGISAVLYLSRDLGFEP